MRSPPTSGLHLVLSLAAALALAACAHAPLAPAGPAAGSSRVALDLGARGRMLVVVPPGWIATPGDAQPPVPASLRLDPPAGHHLLLLTPLWDPAVAPGAPAGERGAHDMADLARQKALETAAEDEVPLVALGGGATGWWFAVTDRELGPGGRTAEPDVFKALLQGAASVGGLVVAFTLLDDGDGPHRAEVLGIVRGVRHEPPGRTAREPAAAAAEPAPPPAPPAAEPPRAGKAPPAAPSEPQPPRPPGAGGPGDPAGWRTQGRDPVAATYPGKGWAVTLAVPGYRVDGPDVMPDGKLVHLVAEDDVSGVVVSVVLSDARGRTSSGACADADWKRIGLSLGEAPPVKRRDEGERVRADYFVASQRGARVDQQNASLWWYRDGVCVHVHASLMGWQAGDEPKLERALAAAAFAEAL
jgi:hypothetical protein